jgi:hypothetical protein
LGAGLHIFAQLRLAIADDTGHGRYDHGVREILAGERKGGARLFDRCRQLAAVTGDRRLLFGRDEGGAALVHGGFGRCGGARTWSASQRATLPDQTVETVAWISFVGALVFFERSFFSAMAVLKLSPFRRLNFVLASVLNLVIGVGLYASTYLTPIFLGRVHGYSSLEIGSTVFVTGIFMISSAPLAARLTTILDQRIVMATGFALFAWSSWMLSGIGADWGFWELFVPQALRGFAFFASSQPSGSH